jgi:hypothetical protein
MRKPATWATAKLPKEEGERRGYKLTRDFRQQWLHSVKPVRIYHVRLPLPSLTIDEFDALVAPFSNVGITSRLLMHSEHGKAIREMYHPGKPRGLCHDDERGNSFINTYMPSPVRDYTDQELKELKRREPDFARPFEEFLDHLVPDLEARARLKKWVATLLACPGLKMTYGVLLISQTQGVGKTTLGKILIRILGEENAVIVRASTIAEDHFTHWTDKQLLVINEIYEGHSIKMYEKLKEDISDDMIPVRKMHQMGTTVKSFVHLFACSNHLRAMNLTNEDRRVLVIRAAENKRSEAAWIEFNEWLDEQEGIRKVKQWAKDHIKKYGAVRKGEEAPMTEAKREMAKENLTEC